MKIPATPLWDRQLAQRIDNTSTQLSGVPTLLLMEEAGLAVARSAQKMVSPATPIIILVGAGNNGGDALVAARYLIQWGYQVVSYLVSDNQNPTLTPSCRHQVDLLRSLNHKIINWQPDAFASLSKKKPLVIDGILGLGFKGPLQKGPIRSCLQEASVLQTLVLAVDLPSGCDADQGEEQDIILQPTVTVTFGELKPCHVLAPSRSFMGQVQVAAIGFSQAAVHQALNLQPPIFQVVSIPEIIKQEPWQNLSHDAHKFDRGHVLVIGGSPGKWGAPVLAAAAAYRGGAGWVSVATSDGSQQLPGLPVECTRETLFSHQQLDLGSLENFIAKRHVKAMVIGPGTVESLVTLELLNLCAAFQRAQDLFLVWDAAAIKGLRKLLQQSPLVPDRTIITPHPGEWQSFWEATPAPTPLTTAGRPLIRAELQRCGTTMIYKTATPLVIEPAPDVPIWTLNNGTNALAKAGSGDILAGLIAAHGAAGWTAAAAAARSQALIGETARILVQEQNKHSILASDIIKNIGRI